MRSRTRGFSGPTELRALRAGKTRLLNEDGLASLLKNTVKPTELKSNPLDLGRGRRLRRTFEKSEGVRSVERLAREAVGSEDIKRFVWVL
jgi:hypothetical protein